jgi:hypothetical protein
MLLIKINKQGSIKNIEKQNIDFIKNNKHIEKLNVWNYNSFDYILYGCSNGDAGEENKYDLPPPVDCELYFNDLYFLKYENDKIVDLTIEDYNNFYNDCFGGFEDIENTDEEEDDTLSEHTSDRDFINDSDISLCDETNDIDLSELSDFTSEENKTKTNESEEDNSIDNYVENDELSSIEITVSSCDDIEDDLDVDTE